MEKQLFKNKDTKNYLQKISTDVNNKYSLSMNTQTCSVYY